MQTFLKTKDDMSWLAQKVRGSTRYKYAILYGNEDCPTKIELFARDDYQCKPMVYEYDEEQDKYVLKLEGEKPKTKA